MDDNLDSGNLSASLRNSFDHDVSLDLPFNSMHKDQSMDLECLIQQKVNKSIKSAMSIVLKKIDMLISHKVTVID